MDRRVADSLDPRQLQSFVWSARCRRNRSVDIGRGVGRSIRAFAARAFRSGRSNLSVDTQPARPQRSQPGARAHQMAIRPHDVRCRISGPVGLSGQLEFVIPDGSQRIQSATILAAMRDALVRSGVAVAETDGFQSYDLEIVVPPMIRVPINALRNDVQHRVALANSNRPETCIDRCGDRAARSAGLGLCASRGNLGSSLAAAIAHCASSRSVERDASRAIINACASRSSRLTRNLNRDAR